ncbi:hypothetical protein Q5752_000592 [Cryptotrichosporon argae]
MPPSTTATLIHAASRVAARSIALQIDEVAAASARAGAASGERAFDARTRAARAAEEIGGDAGSAGSGLESTVEAARHATRPAVTPASAATPGTRLSPAQTTLADKVADLERAATMRTPTLPGFEPVLPPVLPPAPAPVASGVATANAESGPSKLPRPAPVTATMDAPALPRPAALTSEEPSKDSDMLATPVAEAAPSMTAPSTAAPLGSTSAKLDTASVLGGEAEIVEEEDAPVVLRASKVPSSRLGRLFHYGSLAASLSVGAATESIRRTAGGGGSGSVFMSDANVRRLVATLGRMRGAALKLGQFMSIQDNNVLPPEIEQVLHQVQQHANYMPDWQMEQVLRAELGSDWASLFSTFDRTPVAAASIGQVHRATLPDGTAVALKIQFPGVSSSIHSDLANISLLLRGSAVLPRGLYLQNTIAVMRRELEDECDYVREAAAGTRFRELLAGDDVFQVPRIIEDATTARVLTTEWMGGRPLSRMKNMSQATRDKIGESVLRLSLQELFQFRFMQTDPNWGNFLYDASTGTDRIQLIDFGASREYTTEFMDGWWRLLDAAMRDDKGAMKAESERLGYLTGEEKEVMLDAHLESMSLLASPFRHEGLYPFASQTITARVRQLIPVMLQHRLTPPPPETYSLNRKLSGAFLMCARLGANVDCRALWERYAGGYEVRQ